MNRANNAADLEIAADIFPTHADLAWQFEDDPIQ
jgi:hypothetical protein